MGTSGQRSLKSKSFIKQTPPKVGFLIKIQFRNFQKSKIKLKKDPLKFQKIQNSYKENSIKKVRKEPPPKVGILILDPISKFSKIENETQKVPLKLKKIQNRYKGPSNNFFFRKQAPPPKSGHS